MPDQLPYRFFDLHAHHVLKTLFQYPSKQYSPWFVFNPEDAKFGNALESQSCFTQVCNANINLICMAWQAPEMGIVRHEKLWLAASLKKLYMNVWRLIDMSFGKKRSDADYQRLLENELNNIYRQPRPDEPYPVQKKLKIINSMLDYDANDLNTLHIILNIEGGYLFYEDNNDSSKITKKTIEEKYTKFFLKEGCKIFYLTATHLTPNIFVNHAYGCKIFKPDKFIPRGHGIQPIGRELLRITYEKKILIDVKHMSLIARQEFYCWRQKEYPHMPIIGSHMGCTGLSWDDKITTNKPPNCGKGWVQIFHEKPKGHLDDTYFNPNSINLYDEEIVEIIKSKGIIGISFDIRILGGSSTDSNETTEDEFLSKSEYKAWIGLKQTDKLDKTHCGYKYKTKNGEIAWTSQDLIKQEDEFFEAFPFISALLNTYNQKYESDESFRNKFSNGLLEMSEEQRNSFFLEKIMEDYSEIHLLFFLNNLIHIIMVALRANLDTSPWDHICIGSDFDGLISAMHCCINMEKLPAFRDMLRKGLLNVEKTGTITLPKDVDKILDDLFFNNAYRLLEKYFQ